MTQAIPPNQPPTKQRANQRVLARLLLVTVGMFGFGYALVPLYDVFCDITGLNRGAEQALVNDTQVQLGREVLVQFDATNLPGQTWKIRPVTMQKRVHPGALAQVEYEIENLSNTRLVGKAVPSYAPQSAAQYFKKIECFCFREQTLEAREVRRLPVMFVLDKSLPHAQQTVTLSYTFFKQG